MKAPPPHLVRTPGQLEKFPESFIEEIDDILIQPEWFNAWEGYFKEELSVGTEYERLIQTTMAEFKDRVVPQMIGQWLFVLENACKLARLKKMKDWPKFVKAYQVLIAKLILSDAYALFTHHEKEDRTFLEGLALWAGHDYSSAKGQDIAYWAEEYRRLILRKGTTADVLTYHQWSNRIRVVLQGPRAHRELAQIVVYSTKCMGKGNSLYVPQNLMAKIQQRGGTGYVDLPDYFGKYCSPPKEKLRARSSSLPTEDLLEPDIPLSEKVLEPRARRPARAISPSTGLGGLDTSRLDPEKLKEGVGKPQREPLTPQEGSSGERPQGTKVARRQSWSDMVEADEAEAARAKAEIARARAEWEATKQTITGGSLNPISKQPVELPSQLVQKTLAAVHEEEGEPARRMVKRDDKGAAGERNDRATPERQIGESQATTDEESLKEQFNINPVPAKAVEVEPQVEEGPGRAKDAREDAVLKKQGEAEGGQVEEEEGETMEGLEEERPAKSKGDKSAGIHRVDKRERGEKEKVKKEKRDKKKKDKKKKKGQKGEREKSGSKESSLGKETAKKGGPDAAMKMALEILDSLVQAGVVRALRITRGEKEEKDSDSTTADEEEGEDEEREQAKKESAQEREKGYGHIFKGGTRTKNTRRMTAGSARRKQPPTGEPPAVSSRETTPEVEEEGGTESNEERRIERLKVTNAQLDEELRLKKFRIAEKEKRLQEEREEAALVLQEQRAVEEELPEGVEKVTTETVDEVRGFGECEGTAKEGEEGEGDALKDERTEAREELEEEGEPTGLKGEHAGERERIVEESEDEVMEEGQAPEPEYQTIEMMKLLMGAQRRERREKTGVKILERKLLNEDRDIQLPDAPSPAPAEMMETEEPATESQDRFQGRETWDVTFKVGDKVRIEQMMQNGQGEMEEPIETEFSVKRFFDIMETWPPNIRSFKFQIDAIPPLLKKVLKEGVKHAQ
jgi:hypothetical protein